MGLQQGIPARNNGEQNIQYLRKAFTYLDDGKTITIGEIPAGARFLKPISGVAIDVAFNGGTTNTLDIGPSTDAGTDLWATLLALGTIGFVPVDEVVSSIVAVDTLVQAKVVSTASASAGSGEVVLAFLPPN